MGSSRFHNRAYNSSSCDMMAAVAIAAAVEKRWVRGEGELVMRWIGPLRLFACRRKQSRDKLQMLFADGRAATEKALLFKVEEESIPWADGGCV